MTVQKAGLVASYTKRGRFSDFAFWYALLPNGQFCKVKSIPPPKKFQKATTLNYYEEDNSLYYCGSERGNLYPLMHACYLSPEQIVIS